jgi:hypothetical protein
VDSYGRALLSSSFGAMVSAMESGQIGRHAVATSEPAHDRAVKLLQLAREVGVIEGRLRAMSAAKRHVLMVAYCGNTVPELTVRYDRLASVVLLTEAAKEAYRKAEKKQRANGRRLAEWLRKLVGSSKNLTGDVRELSEKIHTEADVMLSSAVEAWEKTRQSGGRCRSLQDGSESRGRPYIVGFVRERWWQSLSQGGSESPVLR